MDEQTLASARFSMVHNFETSVSDRELSQPLGHKKATLEDLAVVDTVGHPTVAGEVGYFSPAPRVRRGHLSQQAFVVVLFGIAMGAILAILLVSGDLSLSSQDIRLIFDQFRN